MTDSTQTVQVSRDHMEVTKQRDAQLVAYRYAVNKIDDYLEFAELKDTAEQISIRIHSIIDRLTGDLRGMGA